MPSEHKRSKDDTWRPEELDRALKGQKDDMHRRRRKDDDGDRRHHGDEVNGSSRRRDGEKRSHHRSEDEKKSRRHKDHGDSPDQILTEEDRERMREERRAKREGGKEEKKLKPKEPKPSSKVIIDDDIDDRRHRRRDEDHQSDRRRHGDDEHRKHRDDGTKERRQKERDKDQGRRHDDRDRDRERKHHERDEKERRHHDRDKKKSRGGEEDRKRSDRKEGSSRRHNEEGSDRRRRHEEESSSRRHHRDEEDGDEERERRRQERREKREKEKQRERDSEREKEKDREKESRHKSEKREESRRHQKDNRNVEERRNHENAREGLRSRAGHREQEPSKAVIQASNGKSDEENEDDEYNYEEDFEDYEDDFEDDEDPEMKEEGEMEEVLRALDEENNRLVSTSRRSNWSDSTELSDERFNKAEDEPVPLAPAGRQKTFINFVSAKQRVMDSTVAGKARKRYEDLSKLIELDVAKYDMFDLPPVREYELYIRSFGRSDTKQAYVQTHDDDIERDVQTEEIESLSKWTQHPPDDDVAVGGEGINVQASESGSMDVKKGSDPARLNQFLERAGQVLVTILDEESKTSEQEERYRDGQRIASFSDRATQLGMPNFLPGRQVICLSFCPSEPNSLLSVHTTPYQEIEASRDLSAPRASSPVEKEKTAAINKLSMVCVWNLYQPMYPTRICVSEMSVTCACFSPIKASLVFGGMYDGSVVVWDLREATAQHRSMEIGGESHLVRFPTYNTAGVLETENHHSPVVKITSVHSSIVGSLREEGATESSSGLSFQLASVEEKAVVNLWVVAEVAKPDPAGSEHDLGLFPGGQIKLLRSSAVVLNNPNKYLSTSSELKAIDLQLNPGDLNHFYVGTDAGSVVHGVRFGKRAFPQSHSSLIDTPVPVVSIDFSPFGQPYFLAGCEDGTLHLYNAKSENPIATWREFVSGEKILSVRWSRSRPAVFYVLDNNSTVFTFDLVENGLAASKVDRITVADAISLEVGSDPKLLTPGTNKTAYMVMALDSGSIEVLTVGDEMRKQQPLEEDFLATYIDRY